MCGIVGVFGKASFRNFNMFEIMLKLDVIRGEDSTGIALINKFDYLLIKDVISPKELLSNNEYRRLKNKMPEYLPTLMLGHNRLATKGEVTAENAHPFQHGNITLVHNGTMRTQCGLIDNKRFDSDSENLCYSIAMEGIEKTWEQLHGSATLVWHDAKDNSLNMACNGERPMFFADFEDGQGMMFASEQFMINVAAQKLNAKISKLYYPEKNNHFKFKLSKKCTGLRYETKVLPEQKPVIDSPHYPYERYLSKPSILDNVLGWPNSNKGSRETFPTQTTTGNGKNSDSSRSTGSKDSMRTHTTMEQRPLPDSNDNVDISKIDITSKNMTKEEFYRRYHSCSMCEAPLAGDYEKAVVIDWRAAVCSDCVSDCENVGMDVHSAAKWSMK